LGLVIARAKKGTIDSLIFGVAIALAIEPLYVLLVLGGQ